jgi:spore germination protein KA
MRKVLKMNRLKKLYYKITKPKPEKQPDNSGKTTMKNPLYNRDQGKLSASLDHNLNLVKELSGGEDTGIVVRRFYIMNGRREAGLIYLKNMADHKLLSQQVIMPLMKETADIHAPPAKLPKLLQMRFISAAETSETRAVDRVVEDVLTGYSALFIQGSDTAVIISTRSVKKRLPEKPDVEVSILSGKVAFVEDVDINCSLIRSRIPVQDLKFKKFTIGRLSRTTVFLVWIEGVANSKIIAEAEQRIKRIDVDNVISLGLVAELIEDEPLSLWPKYHLTERPDIAAQSLAEGSFAVLCDNVPQAFIAPVVLWHKFQSVDDYSEKAVIGSFIRIIRYAGFFISLFISSIYLAFVAVNHTVIPPALALNIAAGRQGVPFPSVVEVLSMTLFIDVLREVAVRTSATMGPAIGILGAVVIGQAAVAAGYVSPSLIIIIAVSAISTFAIPKISIVSVVRILNYVFILLAGFLGIFGVITGFVFVLWRLVSLRSFGVPFLYPVSPGEGYGLKDVFIRAPFWSLRRRLSLFAPGNRVRMGRKTVKPGPPGKDGDE